MAAAADREKAWARTVTARLISPRPRTLTRPCLWTRPRSRSVSGVISLPSTSASVSRLTTAYSTRKGLLNPFSFGIRMARGSWPPSKPGLMLLRAPWPLVPRPAVLPPLPAVPRPTRRRERLEPGAAESSWIFMLPRSRVRRRPGGGPGRSCPGSPYGRAEHWTGRCPAGRGHGACRGAWAWCRSPSGPGSPSAADRPSRHLGGHVGAALGRHIGVQHALRRDFLGRLAPQPGHLVGPLQGLQPGNRGLGHVDAVGRAERLGQDVVDARHLQDGPRRAAGDDAGTGGGGLQEDAPRSGLADDRVGDGRAGPGHPEQVFLGLDRKSTR